MRAANPCMTIADAGVSVRKVRVTRDLRARVQAILNAVEPLAKTLAMGLGVFTISVAALLAVFAWWILVVQPSPNITPQAQVTMPLFPHGYHAPANAPRS